MSKFKSLAMGLGMGATAGYFDKKNEAKRTAERDAIFAQYGVKPLSATTPNAAAPAAEKPTPAPIATPIPPLTPAEPVTPVVTSDAAAAAPADDFAVAFNDDKTVPSEPTEFKNSYEDASYG